jgi:hypothetical protein
MLCALLPTSLLRRSQRFLLLTVPVTNLPRYNVESVQDTYDVYGELFCPAGLEPRQDVFEKHILDIVHSAVWGAMWWKRSGERGSERGGKTVDGNWRGWRGSIVFY